MAVHNKYRFRINQPYIRTPEDDIEIQNGEDDELKWSKGYWEFKRNIRSFLRIAQRSRCAFCRCMISEATSYSNIEHIVSKKDYSQFEFIPKNLAYCCTKCNLSKSIKNTLNNPIEDKTQQQYPNNSEGFIIINPYYDNYEDHVDHLDDIIVFKKNNSLKGENTIAFYKLHRPELAEQRARELQLDKQTIIEQLLYRLTLSDLEDEILIRINAVIAQTPIWILE